MKRSEINQLIIEAAEFFESLNFNLPLLAHWTPGQWLEVGSETDEIRENELGCDVTDYGR